MVSEAQDTNIHTILLFQSAKKCSCGSNFDPPSLKNQNINSRQEGPAGKSIRRIQKVDWSASWLNFVLKRRWKKQVGPGNWITRLNSTTWKYRSIALGTNSRTKDFIHTQSLNMTKSYCNKNGLMEDAFKSFLGAFMNFNLIQSL